MNHSARMPGDRVRVNFCASFRYPYTDVKYPQDIMPLALIGRTAMLEGKNALITGSTGGIGGAFAGALADKGCNIM